MPTTLYLLDVQSDLLDGLDSRMVIPLRGSKTSRRSDCQHVLHRYWPSRVKIICWKLQR
nr:CcdB family protein [Nitrosomonas eutropha]